MRIPAGTAETIPSYGVGTLGYRSQIAGAVGLEAADSLFGDSGVLLLEVDRPIAADLDCMRPSALPNLVQAAARGGFCI